MMERTVFIMAWVAVIGMVFTAESSNKVEALRVITPEFVRDRYNNCYAKLNDSTLATVPCDHTPLNYGDRGHAGNTPNPR